MSMLDLVVKKDTYRRAIHWVHSYGSTKSIEVTVGDVTKTIGGRASYKVMPINQYLSFRKPSWSVPELE